MEQHLPRIPQGVSTADWGLERLRHQNPLIRAFLTCVGKLEQVVENDYHIMHCSPDRLSQIWQRMLELAAVIRSQLAPVLEGSSKIPTLETARRAARESLSVLEGDLLVRLGDFPDEPREAELLEVRQLLCVAMGALQTFLHAAFGEVMAADPRSSHDIDYYLSRRFPREIQESEWLRENVLALRDYLQSLESDRERLLRPVRAELHEKANLPQRQTWNAISALLVGLYNDLPPMLKEILCLHGIRFEEMTALNHHCVEIPARCLNLFEVHAFSSEILEGLDESQEVERGVGARCRRAMALRLARLLGEIDSSLGELADFVSLWLRDIERRRALVFATGNEALETQAVD